MVQSPSYAPLRTVTVCFTGLNFTNGTDIPFQGAKLVCIITTRFPTLLRPMQRENIIHTSVLTSSRFPSTHMSTQTSASGYRWSSLSAGKPNTSSTERKDNRLIPFGSSSASNIAVIYDKTMSGGGSDPGNRLRSLMNGTTVLDSFFTSTLLQDAEFTGRPLLLPHHGDQANRLLQAMEERNRKSAGTGLRHWNHRCDECFKVIKDETTGEECE